MGLSYSAKTIIGYRVSTKNCFTEALTRKCVHPEAAYPAKFCPVCGCVVGYYIDQTGKADWYEFIDKIYTGHYAAYVFEEDDSFFWFGVGSTAGEGESVYIHPVPYDHIKSSIQRALKPLTDLGLFALDESQFGIWTLNIGH